MRPALRPGPRRFPGWRSDLGRARRGARRRARIWWQRGSHRWRAMRHGLRRPGRVSEPRRRYDLGGGAVGPVAGAGPRAGVGRRGRLGEHPAGTLGRAAGRLVGPGLDVGAAQAAVREGTGCWAGHVAGYSRDGMLYVAMGGDTTAQATGLLTVWRSTDRGRRWDRWLELPGRDEQRGSDRRAAREPVGRHGHRRSRRAHLPSATERLGNLGRSWWRVWDAVDLGVAEASGRSIAVTGLAVSPAYATDRTVFASTSAGVLVSRDGGAGFTAWTDGLQPLSTVAVAPSPGYARDRLVYALGLGGSIWRRSDT